MSGDDGIENADFYFPPEIQECLKVRGFAYVNYLMFEPDNYYNGLRLIIVDKDGNPAPITIEKGKTIYPPEENNGDDGTTENWRNQITLQR